MPELWTGFVVACKNITCNGARDTKLLVVSNRFSGKQALSIYKKRWGIERLFWHLKKKGFDLEATHMTCAKKLDKLFAVLAFLHCQTAWGCQLRCPSKSEPSKVCEKSLFMLGLKTCFECSSNYTQTAHFKGSEPVTISLILNDGFSGNNRRLFSSCNVNHDFNKLLGGTSDSC